MSVNMSCVAHGYKVDKSNELMAIFEKNGTVSDVDWAVNHLLQLLENRGIPLTGDAKSALISTRNAYNRDGLSGALVHVNWLLRSIQGIDDGEIKWAKDCLAEKLTQQ